MTDAFIGEIRILPYTFVPFDWAFCNGQILPISQNQALYAVIGGAFGGNWRTTMGVPDLQARAPMGVGISPGLTPRQLGEAGGSSSISLTYDQLPAHKHTVYAYRGRADENSPAPTLLEGVPFTSDPSDGNVRINAYGEVDANLSDMAYEALDQAGSSFSHQNMQPCLGINFCLAMSGIFPARN